jgi:hypothetical protein
VILAMGGCDFNITDPNNPGPIGNDPSPQEVASAAIGIILAARTDAADWNLDAGIIGREAYRFDGSDPRFIGELLEGPLDPGGGAFGGDHWFEQYAAIRTQNELLNVLSTASRLSAAEQSATRGFAETFQAYEYLMVLMGHRTDSIPVDVNRAITDPPAPFVSNDSAFRHVTNLLDSANAHLAAGGGAFPFALPPGFTGFATPATFQQFNRALKARVEVYRGSLGCGNPCYTAALTALGASFVDTTAAVPLTRGVYFDYSTNPGDIPNPLFQNPLTGENFAHPSVSDSMERKTGGFGADTTNNTVNDNRWVAKVIKRQLGSAGDPPLASRFGWIRYPRPDAQVPIIRNEELILLRAEANNALGNALQSANDINYIRVASGGLPAIGTLAAAAPAARLDQLVRERRYSLLYEGHRWFDMIRLGRLSVLPIDRPGVDVVHATLPVPLNEVLARQ